MEIDLKNVRLAFANIFEAKAVNDGAPQYSAIFIIEPGSANAKALKAGLEKVAKEKWADKAPGILKTLISKDRVAYREGPKTNSSGVVYDGFEDKHYVSTSNKVRQQVVDRNLSPLTADDGKPYSGCYVNARVRLWVQDNQFGQRINCEMGPIQFVADGASFGGGAPMKASDAFAPIEDGADAESMV